MKLFFRQRVEVTIECDSLIKTRKEALMKRRSLISLLIVPLLLVTAGISLAGVNVNVNIGLPPVYTFPGPPELVVIPNTYVYYPPLVDLDIVFYHGYWYRPYNGYWYRGSGYNGPWHHIGRERVPRYIINLPPDYRRMYHDYPRIPHHYVHSNWNRWERERYWNKREWKHEQKEWQGERRQMRREDRRDHHQEMRQDRREHKQNMKQNRQEHRQDRQGSRAQKQEQKHQDKDMKQKNREN